jgi:translation initiation factor IF-3
MTRARTAVSFRLRTPCVWRRIPASISSRSPRIRSLRSANCSITARFRFDQQKKAAEARKKQKTVEVKEIKLRPAIDKHDYETKMKAVRRFFEEGDKVKITLRFRGREMAHQEIGLRLLERVKDETVDVAKVELEPQLEGRQMIMILAPR